MGTGLSIAVAALFVWLGMVLAISFLEAPLKFRAPGVTLALGLGIGRLVFRALNGCEAVLAAAVLIGLGVGAAPVAVLTAAVTASLLLTVQVLAVRPALTRRSDAVLAGAQGARSHAHHVYLALEVVKVVALLIAGTLLLTH
jgi:hypothetical protein